MNSSNRYKEGKKSRRKFSVLVWIRVSHELTGMLSNKTADHFRISLQWFLSLSWISIVAFIRISTVSKHLPGGSYFTDFLSTPLNSHEVSRHVMQLLTIRDLETTTQRNKIELIRILHWVLKCLHSQAKQTSGLFLSMWELGRGDERQSAKIK